MTKLWTTIAVSAACFAGCDIRDSETSRASRPPERRIPPPLEMSVDDFRSMWKRGGDSFALFESSPMNMEMAKAIAAYVHFNIMMYGLGAWSATPTVRPGADGPEQSKGKNYQTFSRIRRASYILLGAAELNAIFDKYDLKPRSEYDSLDAYINMESALHKEYLELYNKLLSDPDLSNSAVPSR